ncbi:MAG: LysM peptidoglycan-binding domain-containing protein [Flavobacterium sp.]
MIVRNIATSFFLIIAASVFGQNSNESENVTINQTKISYLDSLKSTFKKHVYASKVDSLWLKELTNVDLYEDISTDIKNINLDEKVDYELSTELLKARLKVLDAKSPFNITYNQGLENIIKSFLKNRKKSFERLMAISEYYFPQFEEALARENVPLEIKYLAVVESALNPKAVSRVGATGLWQFMYHTGKEYNLNIDSYIDERSDPLLASRAAAKYMSNMYKIFGDWELVLASYNSGPGNVTKAIRRSGGKLNFWKIRPYLPKETQGYVPAFLATMYIYEYHKEHGIVPSRAKIKHFATDTIMIKQQISFRQLSELLDVPVAQLQLLNPSYKMNMIPYYKDVNHFLRLPSDKIAVFTSNEEKIYAYVDYESKKTKIFVDPFRSTARKNYIPNTQVKDRIDRVFNVNKTKYHTVRKGDNLSGIAQKFNVSVAQIKKWNRLKSSNIPKGKRLKIHVSSSDSSQTGIAKNEVKSVEVKETSKTVIASTENKLKKEKSIKDSQFYTVKKGDNLAEIAKKYDVSISELKDWNNLPSDKVAYGRKLRIAKPTVVSETPKVNSDNNENTIYVVQKGDNLGEIAKKFNVSIEELKDWNELSSTNVILGSKLKVSKQAVAVNEKKKESSENPTVYVVQKGDYLSIIAKKFDVTVSDLRKWNKLEKDDLISGTKLIVMSSDSKKSNTTVASNSKEKNKTSNSSEYLVQKGDSLFTIAQKYPGVTISDIKKWNDISGDDLKPGMKLKING